MTWWNAPCYQVCDHMRHSHLDYHHCHHTILQFAQCSKDLVWCRYAQQDQRSHWTQNLEPWGRLMLPVWRTGTFRSWSSRKGVVSLCIIIDLPDKNIYKGLAHNQVCIKMNNKYRIHVPVWKGSENTQSLQQLIHCVYSFATLQYTVSIVYNGMYSVQWCIYCIIVSIVYTCSQRF